MLELDPILNALYAFLQTYYGITLAASGLFGVLTVFVFGSQRIFGPSGRIFVDLAWVLSGSLTLFFVVIGIRYDSTLPRIKDFFHIMNGYRQEIGHDSRALGVRYCSDWENDKIDINQFRIHICEKLRYANQRSFYIGTISGFYGIKYNNIPLYEFDLEREMDIMSANDAEIYSDYNRIIPYAASQYNGYASRIAEMETDARIAFIIAELRLIALHFSVISAVLRISRAIHELNELRRARRSA